MKTYTPFNSLLLGSGALAIGILLIMDPQNAVLFGVKFLGILTITISAVQFLVQLAQNRKSTRKIVPVFAVIGIGFGIALIANPDFWVKFFMMLLGIIMILLSINQIYTYIRIHHSGLKVSWAYYIFPILLLAAGVVTIIEPAALASSIAIFAGAFIILYGIVELISYFSLRKRLN